MSIAKQILELEKDRQAEKTRTLDASPALAAMIDSDIADLAVQLAKEHEQQIETLRDDLQAAQREILRLKSKGCSAMNTQTGEDVWLN